MGNNKPLLVWELPFIQEILSKGESLKNRKLPHEIVAFLLYKTQFSTPNRYWSADPPIPEREINSYWKTFKNFLSNYDLFREDVGGNWKVELIFIHAFIPVHRIDKYLNVVYKYFEKGKDINFNDKNVRKDFEKISATFKYILKYPKLVERLERISKNIIDIWNDNIEVFEGPFWLYKKIINFKQEKELLSNLKNKILWKDPETGKFYIKENFKKDIVFVSKAFKEVPYTIEDHHIYLSYPASYVIVKNSLQNISFKDNVFEFTPENNKDYRVYYVRDPRFLEGETINNMSIVVYPDSSKYLEIKGEQASYVVPEEIQGKVFYGSFSIHTKEKFVNYLVELPDGTLKSKEDIQKGVFDKEGVYNILYEVVSKEKNITFRKVTVYLLKENPKLIKKNLKIQYKGKNYSIGDYIDVPEFKGYKLKVAIAKIEKIERAIDNILKFKLDVLGTKEVPGLFLTVKNRCGMQIYYAPNLSKNTHINLDQIPRKYLNFPFIFELKTSITYKDYKAGKTRKTYVLLDRRVEKGPYTKACPYKHLWVDLLRVSSGKEQKYQYKLIKNPYITNKEKTNLVKLLFRFGYKYGSLRELEKERVLKDLEYVLNNLKNYKSLKGLLNLREVINRNFLIKEGKNEIKSYGST